MSDWSVPGRPGDLPELGPKATYVGYISNEDMAKVLEIPLSEVIRRKNTHGWGGWKLTPEETEKLNRWFEGKSPLA